MRIVPKRLNWTILAAALALSIASANAQNPANPQQAPAGDAGPAINYTDPLKFMQQGGPLMWPILLCSVASITFGLERFVALRRARVIPNGFVRRFFVAIQNGEFDRPTAVAFCKMNPSPTANVFAAAVRLWGRPLPEVNEAVREAGEREAASLRRNLRALNASANISTLLGLLGTVIGMIDAFNTVAISRALGRAELLAHGIAVALLTTAFGLVVAIPSVLMYNFFASRAERLLYEIDAAAADLVDTVANEGRITPPAPQPSIPHPPPRPKANVRA